MMVRRKTVLAAVAAWCLCATVFADGVGIYVVDGNLTGYRTTENPDPDPDPLADFPGGVLGLAGWAPGSGGFRITWDIELGDDGLWGYEYTLTNADGGGLVANPAVSHWILEVSSSVSGDVAHEDYWGNYFTFDPSTSVEFGDWSAEHPSNPGMPEGTSIYGFKFDWGQPDESDDFALHYGFSTTKAPVWGDFYAKDGGGTLAYNTGLLDPDVQPTSPYINWIASPDTLGVGPSEVVIPEPGTAVLAIGAVLAGVFARRRRRRAEREG